MLGQAKVPLMHTMHTHAHTPLHTHPHLHTQQGDESRHSELRARVCSLMADRPDDFAPFVEDDQTLDAYLTRMRKEGVWAGHMELQVREGWGHHLYVCPPPAHTHTLTTPAPLTCWWWLTKRQPTPPSSSSSFSCSSSSAASPCCCRPPACCWRSILLYIRQISPAGVSPTLHKVKHASDLQ